MEGKRELDGLVEGKILEVGNGLVGDFRSAKCLLSLGACLLDTAKNGVSPAPFKFNNSDEKMGANLFTTVSIAVALEGSAGKAASAAGRKITDGVKKVLPKLLKKIGKLPKIPKCFPPGTQILMADGSSKNIEDVDVGDWVIALDPDSGEVAEKEVIDVHRTKTRVLFNVSFDSDSDGVGDGQFKSTGSHPIWTKNRAWVEAKNLEIHDQLLSLEEHQYIEVVGLTMEPGVSKTYNLSVEGTPTFFIVPNGTPILVHNLPRIHGFAPDWATKGAHVTTSQGIELSLTGGGKEIKISPVFSRDRNNSQLSNAIKETRAALKDKQWRGRLLERTRKATKALGQGKSAVERAGSGRTRALEINLERWCP